MTIVFFLIPIALLLSLLFIVLFVMAVKKGQYDDLDTPAHKILLDDED